MTLSTYHVSPVAAAEQGVTVGGFARAVGAPLVGTIACTTGISGLDLLRDGRSADCHSGGKSVDDSGELHGENLEKGVCLCLFGLDQEDC
jgi:hypothetical protein